MMLIYISGPYTTGDIDVNIQRARKVAIDLWEMGHSVICPHLNTYRFEVDCKATYEQYIKGDLEMISRVDALVMLPGWGGSRGASVEWNHAKELGIPIYYTPDYPPLKQNEGDQL